MIDLSGLVEAVGVEGPVTAAGTSSREGGVPGIRCVQAPAGIVGFEPEEMIVRCGAGTTVSDLQAALAERGQYANLPTGGTVGGALAMGRSALLRLGRGPVRDALLQARYVSASGEEVTAGGPTVKNVSGFDLCRLLVGSRATLGVLGEVILRTRPLPPVLTWFRGPEGSDPFVLAQSLHRPSAVLWDGRIVHVCLEGHASDVSGEARSHGLVEVEGPPALPVGGRWSIAPGRIADLDPCDSWVAEIGVGIVHHRLPAPVAAPDPVVVALNERIKQAFDPTGRLSPGRTIVAGA